MSVEIFLKYFVRIVIIFLILPLHEMAHAWAAHKLGDDTAQSEGRLTLNPLAHIDPFGAICLVLTGFGWARPVPINPRFFNRKISMRGGMALTAAAGPISNLLVAFLGAIGLRIVVDNSADFVFEGTQLMQRIGAEENVTYYAVIILQFFVLINLGLAVFNLIPIPPLDGSKIVGYFVGPKLDRFLFEKQQIISIVFLLVIVSRILDGPLGFLQDKMWTLMMLATSWIPKLVG